MQQSSPKYTPKPRLSQQEWKNQQFQKVLDRQKYSKKRQEFFVLQRKLIKFGIVAAAVVFLLLPLFGILDWGMSLIFMLVVILVLGAAYISASMQEKSLKKMLIGSDSLDKLYALNPFDFEEAVAAVFRKHGFQNVKITPSSLDGGIDIIMEKNGESYGVQCKKYDPESYLKIEIVKAVIPSCQRLGLKRPVFVTTAKFSDHTKVYMKDENMWLIDGAELVRMMKTT
ncbi:MAG: restriction endonuclease [Candidatus Gracilibacteria bacterium]